jgi:hypothetical protein
MSRKGGLSALDAGERAALAQWLGDTPFTALASGQLRQGLCRAYVLGTPGAPRGALVQSLALPTEPAAFGTDVETLWALLSQTPGWDCVNVEPSIAPEIAALLERGVGGPVRRVPERYYALDREPAGAVGRDVRRLGPGDAELVVDSDPLFREFFLGHGDVPRTLAEGVVAGAFAGGTLVSVVTTSAWSGLHVDLGAATVSEARRQGFATQAARVVCAALRAARKIPVWAAADANPASWHIPEKLGFRFVGRREYVVVESLRPVGFRPS